MPLILRKIKRSRWYNVPYPAKCEIQADALENALKDFQTDNSEISVWCVRDDRSNLQQIVIALAANCDHISKFDYLLFDKQILSDLDIQFRKSMGDTPDHKANSSWHIDLIELSAPKLLKLVRAIMTSQKTEKGRFLPKKLLLLIAQAVTLGQIDRTKLKQGILSKINNAVF